MKKINKWRKRIFITSSFLLIAIIVVVIYNQLVYALVIGVGSIDVYYGNDERGNRIMSYSLSKIKKPNENTYHAISVQNTKNGNYNIAIPALEKAYVINPNEVGAYYGWVLLYYYHDYQKALQILNVYDDSTPKFSDWPMGECIHYLKGLSYMKLNNYEKAIEEFDISIYNTSIENGENWVDYSVFLNKGIALFNFEKYDEAIIEFNKAIKDYDKCSEAYYYVGLSYLELGNKNLACENLNKSYSLISQGYKSSDTYVELFHEIYIQQVEQSILENCKN